MASLVSITGTHIENASGALIQNGIITMIPTDGNDMPILTFGGPISATITAGVVAALSVPASSTAFPLTLNYRIAVADHATWNVTTLRAVNVPDAGLNLDTFSTALFVPQIVSVYGNNLQNAAGVLIKAGTLTLTPTDGADNPILSTGFTGLVVGPVSSPIRNGSASVQVCASAAARPANLNYRISIADSGTWEVITLTGVIIPDAGLNLDTFDPSAYMPQIPYTVVTGPAGLQGPKGDPGMNPVGAELQVNKGVANGYAPLDASGDVPLANLPVIPATQTSGLATKASPSFTGVVQVPDGSQTAPTYSFTSAPNMGMFVPAAGGYFGFTSQGSEKMRVTPAEVRINSLGIGSNLNAPNVMLYADAANLLAMRNGINSQTQYIYNTYTDASNYERMKLWYNTGGAGSFEFKSESAGTGVQRGFQINANGNVWVFRNSNMSFPSNICTLTWGVGGDTGISRPAAKSVAIGNGGANDQSGILLANTVAVNELTVTALATPVNAAFATASTGGTLVPGTYYYRVAAIDAVGTTLASTETSQVVPAGTNTNTVTVNWAVLNGATGYKVYGRTTGAELLMATIASGSTLTWVDNGSVTPAGALPASNTTGILKAVVVLGSDGTAGTPTYSFSSETGTGFYKAGTNIVGCSVAGSRTMSFRGTAGLRIGSVGLYALSSDANDGLVADVGVSRVSAGVLALGNGLTVGDTTGNLQLNKITKYNGNATAGLGVAPFVVTSFLTGQTASVGSTTLIAVPAIGTYRVNVITYMQAVGSAGTVQTFGSYNTGYAAITNENLGAAVNCTVAYARSSASVIIHVGSTATPLAFYTTVTGATGTPQYGLDIIVEQLA